VEDLLVLPMGPGAAALDLSSTGSSAPPVLFLARPTPPALAAVAAAVVSASAPPAPAPPAGTLPRRSTQHAPPPPPPPRECRLALIPSATLAARRALAAGGALGALSSITDLPIGFLPIDADTLSLEDPRAWRALAAEGDVGPAAALAAALDAAFAGVLGGAPATLRGVGPASDAVRAALATRRAVAGPGAPAPGGGWVDEVILLDRCVDPLTPLLTALSYEGLVGEVLGPVRGGVVALPSPPSAGGGEGHGHHGHEPPPPARVPFGAGDGASAPDPVFTGLRDAPFPAVGPALAARARALQAGYREAAGGGGEPAAPDAPAPPSSSSSISSLRALAAELKSLPLVQRHVSVAEAVGLAAAGPAFRARMAAEAALLAGGGGLVGGALGAVGGGGSGDAGAADKIEDALCLAGAGSGHGDGLSLAATSPAAGARLLALHALTAGGGDGPWGAPTGAGPAAKAAVLRKAFLAAHGPAHLSSLVTLEAAGLLRRPDGCLAHGCGGGGASGGAAAKAGGPKSAWAAARRPLRLVVPGGGLAPAAAPAAPASSTPSPPPLTPTDAAYVCAGGVAPLSVRLVEAAVAAPGGWAASPGAAEALRALPGPAFEVAWGVDGSGRPTETRRTGASPSPAPPPTPGRTDRRKNVLVAFVGGATRAEVGALRWLSEKGAASGGPRFLVAATSVGSGEDLIRAFCE